jgi:hypothetical protein
MILIICSTESIVRFRRTDSTSAFGAVGPPLKPAGTTVVREFFLVYANCRVATLDLDDPI